MKYKKDKTKQNERIDKLKEKITDKVFNTFDEPIHMTGIPLDKIPPDNSRYLTDRTYYEILDNLCSGQSLSSTLREKGCDRAIVGRVTRWMLDDEERKKEYLLAKSVGAEIMADEMIDIADGNMGKDDVVRDTLRVKTRSTIIAHNNRQRFGKQETNTSINVNLIQAIEDATERATNSIIDAEYENDE